MIIEPFYKNNIPNNIYNNLNNNKILNPLQFYNDLVYRNKLSTTIISPNSDGSINCLLIDYKYLINTSNEVVNNLINNLPNVLNRIESVIITYLEDLNGLGNLIEYFYNNGKKLNIIIPLQPVFMLNFYNEFLINYYDNNGIPMFTINWISIVNSNILENLNSDINTNPTSIFNFIDNQNYDLGNYDMPYTFYDGKQLIKFYFELVDTVYFTYILHVYKFAIKNYQPVIHSIYIYHNENDTNLINIINNYISKNNINNNTFLIFFSYDIEQNNIDLYPQNFVVGLNSNMLNSFKPQQYEETQFIPQYRHTYQPYQYVTYQVNENTEYILTT